MYSSEKRAEREREKETLKSDEIPNERKYTTRPELDVPIVHNNYNSTVSTNMNSNQFVYATIRTSAGVDFSMRRGEEGEGRRSTTAPHSSFRHS